MTDDDSGQDAGETIVTLHVSGTAEAMAHEYLCVNNAPKGKARRLLAPGPVALESLQEQALQAWETYGRVQDGPLHRPEH